MMFLRLKHDRAALLVAVGIVRELVKNQGATVERADVENVLYEHDLHLPDVNEPGTTVYLSTIKQQQFELPPDFLLDWRGYFGGDATKRGHNVLDTASWQSKMLPELVQLESELNGRNAPRLLRARGLARLSAWFAFGYTFSDVARYTIEVDQQGKLWRTDAPPSGLKVVEESREMVKDGQATTVAVGISVTGPLNDDVKKHLRDTRAAAAVLFVRPDRDLGRDCFSSASDVTAFARSAKELMRAFVKEHDATRLLLFYFGPLSGACFLGHQLNAVAREVQIMEDQQPGYAGSFRLCESQPS